MFRKFLIKWLLKLVLKYELDREIDQRRRMVIFKKLGSNPDAVSLFRTLYTRAYKSVVVSMVKNVSDYEAGFFAGRLIELQFILDSMEKAEEILRELDRAEKKNEYFKPKNILLQKLTHLVKKPF